MLPKLPKFKFPIWLLCQVEFHKSSIKPQWAYLFLGILEGGLIERFNRLIRLIRGAYY